MPPKNPTEEVRAPHKPPAPLTLTMLAFLLIMFNPGTVSGKSLLHFCLACLFTYSYVEDLTSVYGEPPKKQQNLDLASPPDTVPVTTDESSSDEEFVSTTDEEADETWFTDDDDDDDDDNDNTN